MLLHTPQYLVFFLVVVLLYWRLPANSWRKYFLLLASYVFYLLFDWRFLVLLVLLTASTLYLGNQIKAGRYPRRYAWLSAIISLGTLGVFKYYGFFLDGLNSLLMGWGAGAISAGLQLLLPIGISFYTFQAVSYTIEIYRGNLQPVSAIDLGLYLAFFPKLIAGPFVRPAVFFKQLNEATGSFPRQEAAAWCSLLLVGLAKKIIIADSLTSQAGVAFQAAALPMPAGQFASPLYWQGFYLYAFQIYADFSGYTDIARASAGLLGFHLPENFQQPYLATTIATFWNRWHMTLTQWFREYLYFPISRGMLSATHRRWSGQVQMSANLITMILIGLWHGAAWTFIAWGLWHGILLSIERLAGWKPPTGRWMAIATGLITFHLVGLGWVLFNSPSFEVAAQFYRGLFAFGQMSWLPYYLPSIIVPGILLFGIDLATRRTEQSNGVIRFTRPLLVIAVILVLLILQLLSFARGEYARPFIYGQF